MLTFSVPLWNKEKFKENLSITSFFLYSWKQCLIAWSILSMVYHLNPFNTKPMAKIAVKMSIMRVVKFMSIWNNDFKSWPKHHQLFFGGSQWSFHWAYTGFPGCHQVATRDFQCEKIEVNIHNLLMFEGLWQPLVSKVTGIGDLHKSGHETPGSSDAMHTPGVTQQILSEIANQKLKNIKFWCMDEGTLSPATPINPYLRAKVWKKWATFYMSAPLHTLWMPQFGTK